MKSRVSAICAWLAEVCKSIEKPYAIVSISVIEGGLFIAPKGFETEEQLRQCRTAADHEIGDGCSQRTIAHIVLLTLDEDGGSFVRRDDLIALCDQIATLFLDETEQTRADAILEQLVTAACRAEDNGSKYAIVFVRRDGSGSDGGLEFAVKCADSLSLAEHFEARSREDGWRPYTLCLSLEANNVPVKEAE